MKNTVNVIEWFGDTIQQIIAWKDNDTGNKKAEKLFAALAKEHGFTGGQIEDGLDDGVLESDGYRIFLVHSNKL